MVDECKSTSTPVNLVHTIFWKRPQQDQSSSQNVIQNAYLGPERRWFQYVSGNAYVRCCNEWWFLPHNYHYGWEMDPTIQSKA